MGLKWYCPSASPGGFIKTQMATPPPEFLISQLWGGAQEYAFLISSLIMLVPLVRGSHWENHFLGRLFLTICSMEPQREASRGTLREVEAGPKLWPPPTFEPKHLSF